MSEKPIVANLIIDYDNKVTGSVQSYEYSLHSPVIDLDDFAGCLGAFLEKYLIKQDKKILKEITQLVKNPQV
jgi:hypothetical protein